MSVATKKATSAILRKLGACEDAREWVGARSPEKAWAECVRGDWLLWCAAKAGVERNLVAMAACQCARLALKHVPAWESRPLKAIETAEAWTRGEATIGKVREAARDAAAAGVAYAAAVAAAAAVVVALYAADAVYAANAAVAVYAANAAVAADAVAALYADDADARSNTLAECAEIVRRLIPYKTVDRAIKI